MSQTILRDDAVSLLQSLNQRISRLEEGKNQRLAPVGMMVPFTGSAIPSGWLPATGSDVARDEYSDLFSVIGTDYGVGNGTTTFTLPNVSIGTPPYFCHVKKNSGTIAIPNATITLMTYDTPVENDFGMFNSLYTNGVSIPVTGIYTVTGGLTINQTAGDAEGRQYQGRLSRATYNGSTWDYTLAGLGHAFKPGGLPQTNVFLNPTCTRKFEAGEVVEMYAYHDTGSAKTAIATPNDDCGINLTVALVSASGGQGVIIKT